MTGRVIGECTCGHVSTGQCVCPRSAPKYHTLSGAQMLRQVLEAQRIMRGTHEKLIAEGYEWDGMDGYAKPESKP